MSAQTGVVTGEELSEIHKVSKPMLYKWRTQGVDIFDSRDIIRKIDSLQIAPPQWREMVDKRATDDEDSHGYWKKEKDKATTEGLRLKNAKVAGEMFDRDDGEKIQQLWAATLQTVLAEKQGTWPQVLAGLTEAEIEEQLNEDMHDVQMQLSDLESSAWEETFKKYAGTQVEEPSSDEVTRSVRKATKTAKRK